jgi:hypothetical protein
MIKASRLRSIARTPEWIQRVMLAYAFVPSQAKGVRREPLRLVLPL